MDADEILSRVGARRMLEEVNHFILRDAGEIIAAPGKLSLVWADPIYDTKQYLAIKAAGDDTLIINGRRFPATTDDVQQGLRACLEGHHR